jgi:hypothetical protein
VRNGLSSLCIIIPRSLTMCRSRCMIQQLPFPPCPIPCVGERPLGGSHRFYHRERSEVTPWRDRFVSWHLAMADRQVREGLRFARRRSVYVSLSMLGSKSTGKQRTPDSTTSSKSESGNRHSMRCLKVYPLKRVPPSRGLVARSEIYK